MRAVPPDAALRVPVDAPLFAPADFARVAVDLRAAGLRVEALRVPVDRELPAELVAPLPLSSSVHLPDMTR